MPRARKVVYPSDLSNAQWQIAAPVLRAATGQPGIVSRHAILNAIFYVLRTGCQWRYLPKSYPNWQSVYSCFRRWSLNGVWDHVVEALRVQVRYEQGRKALPTAAVTRRVSRRQNRVPQRGGGRKGYDGAKQVKGRKRVELCAMSGNLLDAIVVPANTNERALCLLVKVKKPAWSRNLRTIFADNGFGGEEFKQQIQEQLGYKLVIIRRDAHHQGFVLLPKR